MQPALTVWRICFKKKENTRKPNSYWSRALHIRKELLGDDHPDVATSLNNLAAHYRVQGDREKALEYHFKGLALEEEVGNKQGIATSLYNIAGIYLLQDRVIDAKNYAQRSLKLAQELGFPSDISVASELLSRIYTRENNGTIALEMYQLHITMRDSINIVRFALKLRKQKEESRRAQTNWSTLFEQSAEKILGEDALDLEKQSLKSDVPSYLDLREFFQSLDESDQSEDDEEAPEP